MKKRIGPFLLWLILTLNTGTILWFWWLGSRSYITGDAARRLIAFGRLSGLLLVLTVLLQLLLIGRTGWIEKTFGLDKLSRLHHWIGLALTSLLLAHPLFLSIGYGLRSGSGTIQQFLDFQGWPDVLTATVAFILFLTVVAVSLVVVAKKIKYEVWYSIHLLAYAAILLAFGHQLEAGRDLQSPTFAAYWYALHAFVLLNLAYYRFYRPLRNHLIHGFTVEKIVSETSDVISVYIRGKHLERFGIKAGQFMIVRFLSKGFWWQAHPFSLSCAPNSGGLRLTIKKSGDFTAALRNLKPGTKVIIDGPHGVFTADRSRHDKFLFIAGGIGISPVLSLMQELIPAGRDCILLYANREASGTALKGELDCLGAKPNCRLHYIMSDDPAWTGEKGRLDREKLQRLVTDLNDRDIFLCGPPPMMQAAVRDLRSCGIPAGNIHFEKFSL